MDMLILFGVFSMGVILGWVLAHTIRDSDARREKFSNKLKSASSEKPRTQILPLLGEPIKAGEVGYLIGTARIALILKRLVIQNPEGLIITGIHIRNVTQLVTSTPLPADVFSPIAVPANPLFDEMRAGDHFTLSIQNTNPHSVSVNAVVLGEVASGKPVE